MFNENQAMLEKAWRLLAARSPVRQKRLTELVLASLRHLTDSSRAFDRCIDCRSAQARHFFSELSILVELPPARNQGQNPNRNPGQSPGVPPAKAGSGDTDEACAASDCEFGLFEDMALFFRERFLRHPDEAVPDPEREVMDYFETCGEWRPDDGLLVSALYWVELPQRLRQECRLRNAPSSSSRASCRPEQRQGAGANTAGGRILPPGLPA